MQAVVEFHSRSSGGVVLSLLVFYGSANCPCLHLVAPEEAYDEEYSSCRRRCYLAGDVKTVQETEVPLRKDSAVLNISRDVVADRSWLR